MNRRWRSTLIIGFILFFSVLAESNCREKKFTLTFYHFNIQYVAGDSNIENRIITDSLFPLLKMYEDHPTWKATLEIQAYAFEIMKKRFPAILALFKKLLANGQLELVVSHYSAQFLLAYPKEDLIKSIEISDNLLTQLGINRSKIFAAQEWQWSPAYPEVLQGKYDIVIIRGHPYTFFYESNFPLLRAEFNNNEILVLNSDGDTSLPGCEWEWAYFDDGELVNTDGYSNDFQFVQGKMATFTEKMVNIEKKDINQLQSPNC